MTDAIGHLDHQSFGEGDQKYRRECWLRGIHQGMLTDVVGHVDRRFFGEGDHEPRYVYLVQMTRNLNGGIL